MGIILRIIFATCCALFLLSGCSLFDDAVENCEEPQEYQESVTIPPLLVPNYLKNIQNKSIFNISNAQISNAITEEGFVMPMVSDKSPSIAEQNNQIGNIEGDKLSELLQLIDQTISNRQAEGQFKPIYENVTTDYESNPSLKPCLDGPPKYFSEKISPRSMPTQAYTKPFEASETSEEEKSRRQKRIEKRQQKTDKQTQEGTEEDASSKNSEEPVESNKITAIFKSITNVMTTIYTGGTAPGISLSGGKAIVPAKPTRPDDGEIIDQTNEGEEADLADRIRNLAVLDPALNDEQRVFIQNMSDKQILEMAAAITQQVQDQDTDQKVISDTKKINNKVSTTTEDGWGTQVKDQWAEGKAQREARREARQQRRTGGEAPKEEESNSSNRDKNQEEISNEPQDEVNANDVIASEVEDQGSDESMTTDDEIIEEKEAKSEEDDWFTRVKDQWTEGKAQRENRREARQQRRVEQQTQDD